MQIYRLEFEGIGPYPGRHVIDFARLGAGGLFLLEGPTGAGKSTIIDAIVFALYGGVSGGDESSQTRLVSTHLPEGVVPFVDLVVETSRGVLRVRRTPAYDRPKKRGGGTTRQNATVKLWKVTDVADLDGAQPLDGHIQDANKELSEAIGLSAGQFTQTVVLPQGKFADFLQAKPEERRAVLQRIFGTELYERFAQRLREMARTAREAQADAKRAIGVQVEAFLAAAWPDDLTDADDLADATDCAHPADGAASEGEPAEVERVNEDLPEDADPREALRAAGFTLDSERLAELSGQRVAVLDELRSAAEESESLAVAKRDAALAARHQAEDLVKRVAERANLIARRDELAAGAADIEVLAARVEAAERAEHVRRALSEAEKAVVAWQSATDHARAAVADAAHGDHADLVDWAGHDLAQPQWNAEIVDDLRQCGRDATKATGELAATVDLEAGFAEREAQVAAAREEQEQRRASIAAHTRRRQELTEQRGHQEEALARLQKAAAGLDRCQVALAQATQVLAAVQELAAADKEFAEAAQEETAQRGRCDAATRAHDEVRGRWLQNRAGALAAFLVAGEPCAVCGSTSHPAPASASADQVSDEEMTEHEEARERARAALAVAESDVRIVEERRMRAREAAGEWTQESAQQAVTDATRDRDAAASAGVEAEKLAGQVLSLIDAISEATTEIDGLTLTAAQADTAIAGAEKQLEKDAATLAKARGEWVSVAERAASVQSRCDASETLANHIERALAADEARMVRAKELSDVLDEQGFADVATAAAALMAASELAQSRGEVADHRAEVDRVATMLKHPRLAELTGDEEADLDALRAAAAEAGEAAIVAVRRAEALRRTVRAARRAAQQMSAAVVHLDATVEEGRAVVRMDELAHAGDGNERRITLPTFVLLRRFEEVLERANLRFVEMTAGRYELKRIDEKEGGRSMKLGLGLAVVDHHADDRERPPSSLSGGETFLASLTLALGLADAVSAEAGGIDLKTLFIDEGFGSLDPEKLDLVMSELGRLQAGGRSVGVISHVAEMKQRIPERITVTARGDGTSTLTTTLDG